jgi:hypothetical protein
MPSLTDLHRTVDSVLTTQRIGQSVFIRYLLFGDVSSGAAASRLAAMAENVRAWLGQSVHQLTAVGKSESAALSVLLQFTAGATALVSVAPGEPAVDLTILGNHGAIYHRTALDTLAELAAPDLELVRRIERTLAA